MLFEFIAVLSGVPSSMPLDSIDLWSKVEIDLYKFTGPFIKQGTVTLNLFMGFRPWLLGEKKIQERKKLPWVGVLSNTGVCHDGVFLVHNSRSFIL